MRRQGRTSRLGGLQRHALLRVLHSKSEWTLSDALAQLDRAPWFEVLTLEDVCSAWVDSPRVGRRDSEARRATGSIFDRIVLDVVIEAKGWVAAGDLRPHVGGPRWKLQASLGRLVVAGVVERTGKTSDTRYRSTVGS